MPKQGPNHPWQNRKRYSDPKLDNEKQFGGKITFCKNCGHTNRWHSPTKCHGNIENAKCDCPIFIPSEPSVPDGGAANE